MDRIPPQLTLESYSSVREFRNNKRNYARYHDIKAKDDSNVFVHYIKNDPQNNLWPHGQIYVIPSIVPKFWPHFLSFASPVVLGASLRDQKLPDSDFYIISTVDFILRFWAVVADIPDIMLVFIWNDIAEQAVPYAHCHIGIPVKETDLVTTELIDAHKGQLITSMTQALVDFKTTEPVSSGTPFYQSHWLLVFVSNDPFPKITLSVRGGLNPNVALTNLIKLARALSKCVASHMGLNKYGCIIDGLIRKSCTCQLEMSFPTADSDPRMSTLRVDPDFPNIYRDLAAIMAAWEFK